MSEKFDWEAMIQGKDNPLGVTSQPTATGGVSLTITAQGVLKGYLQRKVDAFNSATTDSAREEILNSIPEILKKALVVKRGDDETH